MNRRMLLRSAGATAAVGALPSCVGAAPTGDQAPTIGVLGVDTSPDPGQRFMGALREGLRERGWVDGTSIRIVHRDHALHPERLPGLAAELLALGVRLIVVNLAAAATAVIERDPTVPIVWAGLADPVTLGFAASLARPGGVLRQATEVIQ